MEKTNAIRKRANLTGQRRSITFAAAGLIAIVLAPPPLNRASAQDPMMPGPAGSPCASTTLDDLDPIQASDYDPFEIGGFVTDLRLRLSNTGDTDCQAILSFSSLLTGVRRMSAGGGELVYRLEDSNDVEIPNSIDPVQGLIVTVPANSPTDFEATVRMIVQRGQLTPPGVYTDELRIRLFETGLDTPKEEIIRSISISSQPRAQVNIVGTSSDFDEQSDPFHRIDFGELETGESATAYVQTRSNTDVTISFESENGGVMVHTDSSTNSSVSYQAELEGAVIDLSSGPVMADRTTERTLKGSNYPLKITIGDVSGKIAGAYEDTITINVTPQ